MSDDDKVQEYIQIGASNNWMSRRDNKDASKVYLIQGIFVSKGWQRGWVNVSQLRRCVHKSRLFLLVAPLNVFLHTIPL